MATENIHEAIKPIAWLIGKWRGENGVGIYPTIKTFNYCEEIEFSHPAPHQPVLHLKSTSWFITNDEKKILAHCEYGFLKVRPQTKPLNVCYTGCQNTSISTVEEGVYDEAKKVISLESASIARSSGNKQPEVDKVKREIQFKDEKLYMKMLMSTSTHEETDQHLEIEMKRVV